MKTIYVAGTIQVPYIIAIDVPDNVVCDTNDKLCIDNFTNLVKDQLSDQNLIHDYKQITISTIEEA
jgi:hypothetical protein